MDLIKKADIILYDRLVNPSLLSYSREDAELIYVGKAPANHYYTQEEINNKIINSVKQGKTVVRLKGGDPYLYGRGGEEALELLDKGIEFRVVPGITSVLAAASYAGIPITQRGISSSFHVFSGHDINSLDFKTISSIDGTLLFVMGLRNLQQISRKLIEHGIKKNKPAAVIHYGTTASQQVIKADLALISNNVKKAGLQSPVLIVIGDVVSLAGKLNWYQQGELAGKRIMITRSREQQFELGRRIEELGGEPFYFPTIDIKGPLINDHIR
ncbi:MAG: uroporphyrinogen-III C-methyltransferase [Firmicutes bacterium]|nr:uroporphyrinogen-III C-methyltransferase [Bacillota bacterium]